MNHDTNETINDMFLKSEMGGQGPAVDRPRPHFLKSLTSEPFKDMGMG